MELQKLTIENTSIDGLRIIHPFFAEDERGYFIKTYERRIFEANGIHMENAEDIASFSRKGVIRGLHFQTSNSQNKLVRVYSGAVFDVAVDLRKGSPTFGKWEGYILSSENMLSLYIPSGFAHGYLALTDDVMFAYRCGTLYEPDYDSGIIYDDPEIGVEWPLLGIDEIVLSDKDKKLMSFTEFKEKVQGL